MFYKKIRIVVTYWPIIVTIVMAMVMIIMVTNLLYNVWEREIQYHVEFTKRRIVLLEAGQIVLYWLYWDINGVISIISDCY